MTAAPHRRRFIFGLVARIYLVSIACAALVVGSCALVLMPSGPPPGPRFSAASLLIQVASRELPTTAQAAPIRLDSNGVHDATVTLFADDGRLLAYSGDVPAEPLAPAERDRIVDATVHPLAPGLLAARFAVAGGLHGHGVVVTPRPPDHPRPPVVTATIVALVLISAASLLLARSLARPLRRLADAARRFGEGKFETRVQLARRDEVGQVAAAFDEMADRVQHLLRAQRELLANVSHELRTPLTRLRVGLDLAAESDLHAVKDELAGMGDDIAALDRLVADILSVASLDLAALRETTASPLHVEPIDLAHLARHAAARFAAAAPGHRFSVDVPPQLAIDGDATLLRRVVDNLLENARKYSEPGTTIGLELARDGGHAVLTVRDRGIGIDGADLPHIFTPFFRADRSRARTTGGVGLGLTLAQRIVVAHGGAIGITSHPGVGTTVTVTLPTGDAWATA